MRLPCPGCGALFPVHDGPIHRYIGASSACWALFNWSVAIDTPAVKDLITQSGIPENTVEIPTRCDEPLLDALWGDAYGVQHHGDDSPQAVQSVALHLLNMHGIFSGLTTQPRWPIERAIRKRGVFHKLEPPPLGSALTIRHLFPGGGVVAPVTRSQYVISVYETWIALHRSTVEQWYDKYVAAD